LTLRTVITFDGWLPLLERAAKWNEWLSKESAMQLAGHLRRRAVQEYRFLLPEEKKIYHIMVKIRPWKLWPPRGGTTMGQFSVYIPQ